MTRIGRAAGHANPRGVRRRRIRRRAGATRVEREAQRTLLNYVGCAIGASRHPTVEAALAAVSELAPAAQATLFGRSERVDIGERRDAERHRLAHLRFRRHASAHDHPPGRAGRIGGARARRAHRRRAAGSSIDAVVLGIDVACRVGQRDLSGPLRPRLAHHRLDRHARRRGRVRAPPCASTRARTAMALGIAASQPVGVREQFGTMTKALHPGGAARAGLMSALLAKHGYTASPRALEAPRGLAADVLDEVRLARDHGRARRALRDRVQHVQAVRVRRRDPPGDRRLRAAPRCPRLAADDIERIELRVHPLVLELTGKTRRAPGSRASSASTTPARPASCSAGRARPSSPTTSSTRADLVALRGRVQRGSRRRDRRGRRRRHDPLQRRAHAAHCSSRTPSAASSGR